jgi:hypothetical protein
LKVDDTFLPSLATSAAALGARRGRRKRLLVAARLVFVTAGAVFGAMVISGSLGGQTLDYAGVAALVAFLVVLGIRLTVLGDRDLETAESRLGAVADLVTSHAWRYAVGGRPYDVTGPGVGLSANDLFSRNLWRYQGVVTDNAWSEGTPITPPMEHLRTAPLADRVAAYTENRLAGLRATSGAAESRFAKNAWYLGILVLCVELVGIPAGVVKAFGLSTVDLLGVTAAAAASLAVWAETTNYRERSRIARNTMNALPFAHQHLAKAARSEPEWAAAVGRIEDLLTLEAEAVLPSEKIRPPFDTESDDTLTMSPDDYFAAAAELKRQIWDRLPKLEPDVIVALNPGGAIVGGILYFMMRASDFLPLSLRSGVGEDVLRTYLHAAPWPNRRPDRLTILLVDASIKSGDSMLKAMNLVRTAVESKGWRPEGTQPDADGGQGTYVIRTAVIVEKPADAGDDGARIAVDYHVSAITERFPYGHI